MSSRGGQLPDGWEAFFLDQLPYFLGTLAGLAVMVSVPWLILRRWTWGRWTVITVWALITFASVSAFSNPNFTPEDLSTWWAGPAGLLAVLILARYDRRWMKGQPTEDAE